MEAKPEKREEVMKVLQMMEEGKIDTEKGTALIALLEGKDVIGGAGGVIREHGSRRHHLAGVLLALLFLATFLYYLLFYLPVHAAWETIALVYGLMALIILCVTLVAATALGIGRLAVKRQSSPAERQ